MKSKLFSFLFMILAFSVAYSATSNVCEPIIKPRPPVCPICPGKEYFTLDKLEITEEGIFIHLDEKTIKIRAIYHDDKGFYFLKRCPRPLPKPLPRPLPIKPCYPCEKQKHVMKEETPEEVTCYFEEETDPPPTTVDEE